MELKHKVSKSAANEFWSLSMEKLPKLFQAKERDGNNRKIASFKTIRQSLYKKYVPKIKLEVAYEKKDTGDIIVLRDLESTPVNRFKPSEYTKLYESARVEVKKILKLSFP